MRRLSLQWRITLTTALLVCAACVLTNCLIGYSGMRYMDSIGDKISTFAEAGAQKDGPLAFDPTSTGLGDEVTVIVGGAQEAFGATSWCITAAVTLAGGVLAYFASGRALRPLQDFASQVEDVRPDNLAITKLDEDVPAELARCSASFNDMIARLDEGFSAQRQFTGNAAHELRTPLALMQAQVELFSAEHPDAQPETTELLTLLREQTERMTQMTKALLEMSELRTVPCTDPIDVGPLLEEVATDLAPLAEQGGITLEHVGDARMVGSDTLIYRMVFNLAENAIRYGRPNTTVTLSTSQQDGRILIRVADQGPGIPAELQQSIFQPFFRVDKSRSRARGGVGLGLALVWEIASLHGGTASVEKSCEDGTVMLVDLPAGEDLKA